MLCYPCACGGLLRRLAKTGRVSPSISQSFIPDVGTNHAPLLEPSGYATDFIPVSSFSHCLEWQQSVLHLAAEIDLLRRRRPKIRVHDADETRKLLVRVGQFLDRSKIAERIRSCICGNSVVCVQADLKYSPRQHRIPFTSLIPRCLSAERVIWSLDTRLAQLIPGSLLNKDSDIDRKYF